MRPNVATVRETLDSAAIPAHNTELNYRTKVTTAGQDMGILLRQIFLIALLATGFAGVARLLGPVNGYVAIGAAAIALVLFLSIGLRFTFTGEVGDGVSSASLASVCAILAVVMNLFSDSGTAYLIMMPVALTIAFVVSYFIAKQSAFWMTAHPKVPLDSMRLWQSHWPPLDLNHRNPNMREASCFRYGAYILAVAFLLGFIVQRIAFKTSLAPYAGILSVLAFAAALPIGWQSLNRSGLVLRASFTETLSISFHSLMTFACYNRHDIRAAGIFRFPTEQLRPPLVRDAVLLGATAAFALAIVAIGLRPEQFGSPSPPVVQEAEPKFELDEVDRDYIASLPRLDQGAQKVRRLQEKREAWLAEKTRKQQRSDGQAIERIAPALIHSIAVFFVAALLPPIIIYLVLFASAGHILYLYYYALEAPGAYSHSSVSTWEIAVDRMQRSSEAREREHLLLGRSALHDYPVLLHRDLLNMHGHVLGDSGARKTALAIAPLAAQLIGTKRTTTERSPLDCSVVIIDLKGERWLFHSMREEAKRQGKKFRWFTIRPGEASYIFNPFAQSFWSRLSDEQCAQLIIQGLSLDYGLDYGRGYFSAINETVLLTLLRDNQVKSFKHLHRLLSNPTAYKAADGHMKDRNDGRHLSFLVNRLAAAYALNLTDADLSDKASVWKQAIDMPQLFDEPQVLYFFLPSPLEPVGAPAIGKLALYSLFTAAAHHVGKRHQVYVFIDEFQQMIGESVKLILEQARSHNMSLILAHQTPSQLKRHGSDLSETADACCAFNQVLRASDLKAAKRLVESSGQAMYDLNSYSFKWSPTGKLESMSYGIDTQETIGPRLEPNTIIEVSAEKMASFVRFTEGSGYTQFSGYWTTIFSDFHQTDDEFDKRSDLPWPEETDETVPVQVEKRLKTESTTEEVASNGETAVGNGTASDDAQPDVIRFPNEWKDALHRRSEE